MKKEKASGTAATDKNLITEIVKRVLANFGEDQFPEGVSQSEFIDFFSTQPFPFSLKARSTKATLEVHLHELVSHIVKNIREQFGHIPLKFKGVEGEIDLNHPENGAFIEKFSSLAAGYFLSGLKTKMSDAIDALFNEALHMSIELGSDDVARKVGEIYNYIPQEINLSHLIENLKTQDAIMNQTRMREHIKRISAEEIKIIATRGRPRTWTRDGLRQAVSKASHLIRKEKYRSPTLEDIAKALNRKFPDRMLLSGKSLGQMLKRYEIEWKGIKNPHN
jgi:hypothetical protein